MIYIAMTAIDKRDWGRVISEMSPDIPADEFSLVIQAIQFESSNEGAVNLSVASEFLRRQNNVAIFEFHNEKLKSFLIQAPT